MKRLLVAGILVALALAPGATEAAKVSARVLVPAVSPDVPDGGVSTHIRVDAEPGEGRVYLATPPFSEPDFEAAVQVAIEAASDLTGQDFEDFDFFVSIDAGPDAVVEGPSIGASAAVAAAAALSGRKVRPDVAITGTVASNGTLGSVGGLIEKTAGAYRGGARVLVVPEGERFVEVQNETRIRLGSGELVIEGASNRVDLAELAEERYGMTLVEAATLDDAFQVATSQRDVPLPPEPLPDGAPEEALPRGERTVRVVEVPAIGVAGVLLSGLCGLLLVPRRDRRDND